MNNNDEQERVAIWTVRKRSRRLYFLLFTIQFLVGVALSVVYEIWFVTDDSPMQTLMAVLERSGPMSILAVTASYILTEGIMVLADWIEERRRARIERARIEARAEGRAEGIVEGHVKGIEEGRAEARAEFNRKLGDWNRRRLEAQEQGVPFDEPPPFFPNGSDSDADEEDR